MSPQKGRSSDPKRHRSPIDRDPSPKRYRTDDKPESEIPPADQEVGKVRSDPARRHPDKAPLPPKHNHCGGVGPYRRSCAWEDSGVRRSDPNEHLKDTTSKNHFIEQKIHADGLQKTNKATTAVDPPVRRYPWSKRRSGSRISPLWGLGPGYDSLNRPIVKDDPSEDDSSGDDTSGSDTAEDDASGDDASDVSDGDGDGDDTRTKAEKLLLYSIMGN